MTFSLFSIQTEAMRIMAGDQVYLGRSRKPKVFKPWDECDSFNLDS